MVIRIPDEERTRIIEALEAGESMYSVAKHFHRSRSTIAGIARKHGIHSPNPAPQYAVRAHRNKAEWVRIQKAEKDLSTMKDSGSDLLHIIAKAFRVQLR